jgi:hypothetical protein
MINFKEYLLESATQPSSPLPGVSKILHDFLFHLSGPSDTTKSSYLPEETKRLEINHGATLAHKNMNLPKTSAMIEKGNSLIPHGENIHKRIGEGFKRTFDSMGSESPEQSKAKLKESYGVLQNFTKSYGLKNKIELLRENGKTKKSSGEGVHTKGLALAPHATSGLNNFDVCPRASHECRKNCLGTEAGGNRHFPDKALSSKVLRTHFLAIHPEHAARILDHEIGQHVKKATKAGYKPGVRLNITSDISWEHHAPQLFSRHPSAQFYDYTKLHHRVGNPRLPPNYHLTLSHTGTGHEESNDTHVVNALKKGHTVAMVYQRGKKVPNPTHVEDVKTGNRYPIIGGDHDDNTFDRHAQAGKIEGKAGHGVVSGLKLKGVTAKDAGHFANKVDDDGIIRINK